MALFCAPPPGALLSAPLDTFVAVFHRPSGITHLLTTPAPEILETLGDGPLTREALFDRLSQRFDVEGDAGALATRLEELLAIGLIADG